MERIRPHKIIARVEEEEGCEQFPGAVPKFTLQNLHQQGHIPQSQLVLQKTPELLKGHTASSEVCITMVPRRWGQNTHTTANEK